MFQITLEVKILLSEKPTEEKQKEIAEAVFNALNYDDVFIIPKCSITTA